MCLAVIWPPFLHADSTKYLCLKCNRCVGFGLGRLRIRTCSELFRYEVSFDTLPGAVCDDEASTSKIGEVVGGSWSRKMWLAEEKGLVVDPLESLDILRYACFSQRVFHA